MLSNEELRYIEEQIKRALSTVEHVHYQHMKGTQMKEQYPGQNNVWFKTRLNDLYLLVLAYIEGREMFHLLKIFRSNFEQAMQDDEQLLALKPGKTDEEAELTVLLGFKQFLKPFKCFDYKYVKEEETKKLSSILRNTGFILKNMQSEIINESDIYNQIRWMLGLYYPSTMRKNTTSFNEPFKLYNPDILIPELNAAIEYKYIDGTAENIDQFLSDLRADACNCMDANRYSNFYAVLYIENVTIATPENIEVAWRSKRFPDNWNLILSGSSMKTAMV